MQQLNDLIQEARRTGMSDQEGEVDRIMTICNACRYCEGFCAVFPAMTRRLQFNKADINYLANLCHNCGACLHSCQYAPPNEFAVNVPQAMAAVRQETYVEYAWPKSFGRLYKNNGVIVALACSLALAFFLWLSTALRENSNVTLDGNFYAVFPHNVLVLIFGAVFSFSILALGIGFYNFWRNISKTGASIAAIGESAHDALIMKYLDGGHGEGCNNEDDGFTLWRKRYHHFTFYGFMLCFASTSVATLYHYVLKLDAPYAFNSLPVILGTVGGLGLLIGPIGLLFLNLRRNPLHGDARQKPMDRAFILLLFLISLSGLLLLVLRESALMSYLLIIHLGFVMGLFLTMPYGKFAHGIYRMAALLKNAVEKRQPSTLKLGSD
ncbi:tricarballylate utilization 4Fe-4S protein TcuB [Polynucleobacter sp. es-GGE-1]|uniref:tricarballylate utilization 4Fe-4S protein TcuB n=1 Tax=Polynucleobacter sp. es-GGE-1 TaxID=1819724 RepID=UPI001C0BB4EC|nr:tricarballylate utilization 4Fe-4S protein TcuB [Polynucleobacter sp. es-GGE-1]MBU3635053.1 tricarballylate utilization 4Fe-4S protein TcuB [Polynucleobacter sp. es-GGE-1]